MVQNRPTGKYVRLCVPTDLRDRLQMREVVRSLRTKAHQAAILSSTPSGVHSMRRDATRR